MRALMLTLLLGCERKDDWDSEPNDEQETGDTDQQDSDDVDDDGDGYTENEGDCDDADSDAYPGASEIPNDGIDQDCNGSDLVVPIEETSIDQITSGDLVITEIMKEPKGLHTMKGGWFEILNTSSNTIDLSGLEVAVISYTGSGGTYEFLVEYPVNISPGEFFVFGPDSNVQENGGVHVDYVGVFSLDKNEGVISLSNPNAVIDMVEYNETLYPVREGYTLNLDSASMTSVANDNSQNWCEAVTSYGTSGNYGTPGASNANCPILPDADGDGYTEDVDCNDDNPNINPGEVDDVCNGSDADCDQEIDEDWSENDALGESYEPNESSSDYYQLGSDPNGGADSSTEDLNQAGGTISVEAYIFDEADIDVFAFTAYDNWNDGGFDVTVDSVPSSIDIEIAIDFINTDGQLTTNVATANDNSAGGSEELCVGDLGTCGVTSDTYDSGTYIVRIYSLSGDSCSDSYRLTIQD
jgi:hypothetical protein